MHSNPHGLHEVRGFSLIEILVVVLIIGLLTSLLATQLLSRADDAKIQLAATKIRQLEQALEMYRLDNGRYPTEGQGVTALVRKPASEPPPRNYPAGGYVRRDALNDPWGVNYVYRQPGAHNAHAYDLLSFGPDGQEGSEDDVVNWDVASPQ